MSRHRPRLLIVGETFPWPEVTGARQRLANVVLALSRLGEVDLYAFVDPDRTDLAPAPAHVHRARAAPRRLQDLTPLQRVAGMAVGEMPRSLVALNLGALRRDFTAAADRRYDLVWFHRVETWTALKPVVDAPAIVDLDDLEDRKFDARRTGLAAMGGPQISGPPWRRWIRRVQETEDRRRWQRLQRAAAVHARAVVVCSEEDRRRLDVPNCAVIPNGYAAPARPLGRDAVVDGPVILLAGLLTYPPNRDAAAVLATRIAPLVRERLPNVQVRLVGRAPPEIQRLADPPRVVVTGFVPEMTPELARADAVAVPLRYGGGTRIKILEAFAHRIPVISTTAGAAGLGITHDRELLIADDPAAFARACVAVVTDPRLRARLVESAHRLFQERYRWDRIHDAVVALAARVAQVEVPA